MKTQSSHPKYGARWRAGRIVRTILLLLLVFGVGMWVAGPVAKANLMKQYPSPGRLVDVRGFKMHINCVGQGSPTVILVGSLDDFTITWSLIQPGVAKASRVCSYDRARPGWSQSSPNRRTSGNMVKELHTLLVNANVKGPYVMVGHSLFNTIGSIGLLIFVLGH